MVMKTTIYIMEDNFNKLKNLHSFENHLKKFTKNENIKQLFLITLGKKCDLERKHSKETRINTGLFTNN